MENIKHRLYHLGFCAILATVLLTGSGCTFADPESTQVAASLRTDTKGNEVVGSWYAKDQFKSLALAYDMEGVMTVNSDGTGVARGSGRFSTVTGGTQHTKPEDKPSKFTWKYLGSGVWKYKQNASFGAWNEGTMHIARDGRLYVQTKLICPTNPIMGWGQMGKKEVLVRVDNAQAVEEEQLRDNRSR